MSGYWPSLVIMHLCLILAELTDSWTWLATAVAWFANAVFWLVREGRS